VQRRRNPQVFFQKVDGLSASLAETSGAEFKPARFLLHDMPLESKVEQGGHRDLAGLTRGDFPPT